MMASAQVVETSVNTNSPSQDYITNPDDHSNHNIDSPGFKPFTVRRDNRYQKTIDFKIANKKFKNLK